MVTINVVLQLEYMAQAFLLREAMTKEEERNHVKHKVVVGKEHYVYFDCFCASSVFGCRNSAEALRLTHLNTKYHVFCEMFSKTCLQVR